MAGDTPERRHPDIEMERRVVQLDAKIDRVGDQVERVGSETRSALEMLMKQQDDRWKWFEQRSDMEARNQKQSIELLTSAMVKVQQDLSATETQFDLLEIEQKVGAAKLTEQTKNADHVHNELLRRIELTADNLRWVARTLAGAILTAVIGVVVFLVTHPL